MSEPLSIPVDLHTGLRPVLKEQLGAFWSSVFADQDLVDATLAGRVLSAAQLHLDALEALRLRDHTDSPVFHREHWRPLVIRKSQRNTGASLVVGMQDTPQIGPQTASGSVYLPNEVFTVGGNATYSKVNTYPFVSGDGCRLVGVRTALCSSISAPAHILSRGRDFDFRDNVLVIRKEQDPFEAEGYETMADGDDTLAVLWACDAEVDMDNVADFLAYPLGLTAESSDNAQCALSALWDAVVLGLTPQTLRTVLGAVFDVPTAKSDTTVVSVSSSEGISTIVTDDAVYTIETSRKSTALTAGAVLHKGDFLTDEIQLFMELSPAEIAALVSEGKIGRLSLPPGSIAAVSSTVVLENRTSTLETGAWFKLSSCDTASSPFWAAVMSRTTSDERTALFTTLASGGSTVNPILSLGPIVLANLILVITTRQPQAAPIATQALSYLRRLVPAAASLLVIQEIPADTGTLSMSDEVTTNSSLVGSSEMSAASDDVYVTFVPSATTEV